MTASENDAYQTLDSGVTAEYKVKGSRFLGFAAPVRNEEEAELIIGNISRKFHDATHHCYAYTLGTAEKKVEFQIINLYKLNSNNIYNVRRVYT